MSLAALLQRLSTTLDEVGVPFMLTGSLASTLYGEPRSTVDVDVVVVPTGASLPTLVSRLPEDEFYVSEEAAFDALQRQGQFNVINLETGWKINLSSCANGARSAKPPQPELGAGIAADVTYLFIRFEAVPSGVYGVARRPDWRCRRQAQANFAARTPRRPSG